MQLGRQGLRFGNKNYAEFLILINKTSFILQKFQNRLGAGPQKQNAPKFICQNCLPKPKSLGFQWKKGFFNHPEIQILNK